MKARLVPLFFLACAALPVLALSGNVSSPRRAFSVDGLLFPPEALSAGDDSLVAGRLETLGLDQSGEDEPRVAHPALRALLESQQRALSTSGGAIALPRGFAAGHTFRSETPAGPARMALCTSGAAWSSAWRSLARVGWKCIAVETDRGKFLVGSGSDGKETCLLFLDETGNALFLRQGNK